MAHRMFWDTKTFNIPNKSDVDATDTVMGLNDNELKPGGINKYTDVTGDQESKEICTNTNVTDADTNADMGLNDYVILNKINVITGIQGHPSALT